MGQIIRALKAGVLVFFLGMCSISAADQSSSRMTLEYRDVGLAAKEVSVRGSFTDWKNVEMEQINFFLWRREVSLAPGRHVYQFVVDGGMVNDMTNDNVDKIEGYGVCSVITIEHNEAVSSGDSDTHPEIHDAISEPETVTAKGATPAKQVPVEPEAVPARPLAEDRQVASRGTSLTLEYRDADLGAEQVWVKGHFNDWQMQPMARKNFFLWQLDVSLVPGSYAYVFVVDGKITLDPMVTHTEEVEGQGTCSVWTVGSVERGREAPQDSHGEEKQKTAVKEPRAMSGIQFTYFSRTAVRVYLVGDFNEWELKKDPFVKQPNGKTWTCVKRLPRGTYEYLYWVDGTYVVDPNNPRRRKGRSLLSVPKNKALNE